MINKMSYAQAKKKYAKIGIHKDKVVDRDQLSIEQFKPWVAWAKKRGVGLDFNPTFFSHGNVVDGLTLAATDHEIRKFTAQLVLQKEYKNYPFEAVWEEFCKRMGVPRWRRVV